MAPPTFNLDVEAISGICGSISIACWVVVFSPQIIQNFQRGSADALSVQFIIIWLLGDVFNIIGAIMQGVLPTMIILAIYYTIADIVLLLQCFYYRGFTWKDPEPAPKKPTTPTRGEADERTGLLNGQQQQHHEQRRSSADWTGLSPAVPHISESAPIVPSALQTILWNGLIVTMVCGAGVLGWFLGEKASAGKHPVEPTHEEDHLEFNITGQVFGYLCTVAYIGSRVPQLILNYRRKTTDGLSMLFFLFACLGNVTYVLSIFAYEPRCHKDHCKSGEASRIYGRYILVNLSWLAGSLVTLFLDLGVFVQYLVYSRAEEQDGIEENGRRIRYDTIEEDTGSDDERPILSRGDSATEH